MTGTTVTRAPTTSSDVLAVDLGGSSIKVTRGPDGTPVRIACTGTLADLAAVQRVASSLPGPGAPAPPRTVAIAVPGVLDQHRRRMVSAHDKYPGLTGVDLHAWATGAFGAARVLIENDARAALWGETHGGCADGEQDGVALVLGTGIGTAAMTDGRLLRGRHEHAAILGGHVTLDLDGPRCPCGNVGCAEALASSWALRRDLAGSPEALALPYWRRALDDPAAGLQALFEADDAFGARLRDRYLRVWGALTLTLCHLFEPAVVVLAGGAAAGSATLEDGLSRHLEEHRWPSAPRPRLCTATEPGDAVLRGLRGLASTVVGDAG